MTKYEERIKSLEALGLTTSDAQGVFMCEIMQLSLVLSRAFNIGRSNVEAEINKYYEAPVDHIKMQFEILRTDLVDCNMQLTKLKQAISEAINMKQTDEEVRAVLDRALTGYTGRSYDPSEV